MLFNQANPLPWIDPATSEVEIDGAPLPTVPTCEKARYRLAEFASEIVRLRILGHYLKTVTSFVGL
jgi:hypothetical protein